MKNRLVLTMAKMAVSAAILSTAAGCGRCKDVACFTPPAAFTFQLVDKDSGEDLVDNGTLPAGSIQVWSVAGKIGHELAKTEAGGAVYFIDTAIGWETGPGNAAYELRLGGTDTVAFVYETKEINRNCCTFFELHDFRSDDAGILYLPATDIYQFQLNP